MENIQVENSEYDQALEKIDMVDQITKDKIKPNFRGFCENLKSEIDDLSSEYNKISFQDVIGADTSSPITKKPGFIGRLFKGSRKGGKSRRKYKNKKKTRKVNKKRRVKTRKGRKARKGRKTRKGKGKIK